MGDLYTPIRKWGYNEEAWWNENMRRNCAGQPPLVPSRGWAGMFLRGSYVRHELITEFWQPLTSLNTFRVFEVEFWQEHIAGVY